MALVDPFGRNINYVRISVTDRCNLRCLYCMPPEGAGKITHNDVLRFEELLQICRILTGFGISTVRVTGGEPLVRRGVAGFVGELKRVDGIKRVAMTTNGVLLKEYLQSLADAGLDAVNISLDTLDGERFRYLTRGGEMDSILPAIDMALTLGLEVKINCVPLRGFNEEDIVQLTELAKEKKIAVRFIELLPLGAAVTMQPLPINEVTALIEKAFGHLTASPIQPGSGPAVYYSLPGFTGQIGIIGALSRGFCESCNRLRISAAGVLKPCLAGDMGIDLRSLVRGGACCREIEGAVRELVGKKPAGHSFGMGNENPNHRAAEIFRIGG